MEKRKLKINEKSTLKYFRSIFKFKKKMLIKSWLDHRRKLIFCY